VIRPATAADVEAVLALWRADAATASSTDDVAGVRGLLARDPEALLLAEEDGELVGTLVAGWDGWRGGLYRLVVVSEQRRRGIGAALVEAGEARLRALGVRRVHLLMVPSDETARAFWCSVGYGEDTLMRFVKAL
jgi:ribosomal protein S18 acetylase RimI-like enzyme